MALSITLINSNNGVRFEKHATDGNVVVRYIVFYPNKYGGTSHRVYISRKDAENKYNKLIGVG